MTGICSPGDSAMRKVSSRMTLPSLPRALSGTVEGSRSWWLSRSSSSLSVDPAGSAATSAQRRQSLLELKVQLVTGRTVAIHVAPEETVVALKLRLERIEGLQPESLRPMYQGRELRDAEMVSSFAPRGGSLVLMIWPSGQGNPSIDEKLMEEARHAIAKTDASTVAPLLDQPDAESPCNVLKQNLKIKMAI